MSEVHVEKGPSGDAGDRAAAAVDIEREITKRKVVEAVVQVVLVVLYMIFAFVRDREPGVVALDGASDDWS